MASPPHFITPQVSYCLFRSLPALTDILSGTKAEATLFRVLTSCLTDGLSSPPPAETIRTWNADKGFFGDIKNGAHRRTFHPLVFVQGLTPVCRAPGGKSREIRLFSDIFSINKVHVVYDHGDSDGVLFIFPV